MMRTLLILRCLDRLAAEARELRGDEFSIGRGFENGWVHTKPERYFSKRHSQAADRSPIRRPILHFSNTIGRTPFKSSLRGMARAQSCAPRHDPIIAFCVSG
jgi:hypothetical protein